jgi:GntR family transcriptional regulator / MocR family aminotransferase
MQGPIDLEPLFPDRTSTESLGSQLLRRLRDAVASGFFPPASRLLPSRELAKRLGLSRNTVTAALEQLIAEGYLEARVGAGTFVTKTLHEARERSVAVPRALPVSPGKLSEIKRRLDDVGSSRGPLRVGAPSLHAFPLRVWQRLERENRSFADAHLDYGQSSGLLALRQAISRHIAQFRGVIADPEQIVVVEGTQGALHLTAFVMMRCGDAVAIEDPSYQMASAIFSAHGLVLHGVPVDDDGMRTGELPDGATLAYVSPSHQFPLGGALPLARRTELLEWASRTNAYVVEDDYDSEFDAHPLPALQSLDRDERVIYTGTFSKTLAPGLRLGYVVAPPHLAETFRLTRAIMSLGASAHLQSILADFITQGYFARHIRRMTATYEQRRNLLVNALRENLPPGFTVGPAQTGLHVAIRGPVSFDDVRAADSMADGQRVLPISKLCVSRTDCKGLILGFSAGNDDEVASAAVMLAASLSSYNANRG